jgi:hypothetical protein
MPSFLFFPHLLEICQNGFAQNYSKCGLMFNLGHNYRISATVSDGYRRKGFYNETEIHSYTIVFFVEGEGSPTCE